MKYLEKHHFTKPNEYMCSGKKLLFGAETTQEMAYMAKLHHMDFWSYGGKQNWTMEGSGCHPGGQS